MRKLKRENWCITYLVELLCFVFFKMTVTVQMGNMLPTSQMRSVKNKSSVSSVLWRVNFYLSSDSNSTLWYGHKHYYCPMCVKLFIFTPHALCETMGRRLVGVRRMAGKPKQSFFIPTLPFKVQRKSLSTNLKFVNFKRWNCMLQRL